LFLAEGIGRWLEDDVEVALLAIDLEVEVASLFATTDEDARGERRSARNRPRDLVPGG
jgi:hypothetical protein